ncbi:hypothetical protein L1D54_15480 [Vibrio brasiliensis]|uniref:hypothetical protein n=1 Tax=Vibrio brasiliensis TaxID=170652 RepID=UPI001EFE1ED1|nr:hypothetical protein [Vibrio brasiliensis]MCG9751888.1 hypothetical protein [Vibrio brasiliensis]MCG9783603.1 hypothetical protein [Vibrio brasiliensis]
MSKAISLLQRASSGKLVLVLFVLTNLIYAVILGYSIPLVLSFSSESVLFDMSPTGYSYAEATELLQSLGLEGRNSYLTVQLPIDLVYPLMFAVSYALMITWILKQFLPKQSRLFFVAFIPVLAGVFDYLENASIALMLNRFPSVSETLVTSASSFTIAKSVLTTLFFVVLAIALGYLVTWHLKKK